MFATLAAPPLGRKYPNARNRALRGADQFCDEIRGRLVGSLTVYCGDRLVAEELAQDALVRAFERWDTVGAMASPEAWTYLFLQTDDDVIGLQRNWDPENPDGVTVIGPDGPLPDGSIPGD